MKLALLLGLGALALTACKAHQHGMRPDSELLTIDLTSGLR